MVYPIIYICLQGFIGIPIVTNRRIFSIHSSSGPPSKWVCGHCLTRTTIACEVRALFMHCLYCIYIYIYCTYSNFILYTICSDFLFYYRKSSYCLLINASGLPCPCLVERVHPLRLSDHIFDGRVPAGIPPSSSSNAWMKRLPQ